MEGLGDSRLSVLQELAKTAYAEVGTVSNADRINALDEISKIMGYYAPKRIDIISNGKIIESVSLPQSPMN